MSELIQAWLCLLWILGCWALAIYCAAIGQVGLLFGLAIASLALPIAMPMMHDAPDDER